MKRFIILPFLLLFAGVSMAQGHQPPSPEEHLKKTQEMFGKELQLNEKQQQQLGQAFKEFMESAKKLHDQNPPPPPPPMDPKVKEAFDQLVAQRDDKIKKVLTEDQYKKYLEVEKKMRPPHPGNHPMVPPPPPAPPTAPIAPAAATPSVKD